MMTRSLRQLAFWVVERPVLRALAACLFALLIAELTGVHRFIARLSSKGKLPTEYLPLFHILLLMSLSGLSFAWARRPPRPIMAALFGAAIGYVLSFIVHVSLLVIEFQGLSNFVEAQERLGVRLALEVALISPLLLMGPILGAAPFLFFVLAGRAAPDRGSSESSGLEPTQ